MIGNIVSHYEIVQRVGKGGMGVVYRARDLRLDRHVALKFLPRELSDQAEKKQRFVQEARAASALDHPNICTIHEVGETSDGQLFIAMAHYDGETIKDKIARGPLPIDEVLDLAEQVSAGLAAAHTRGLTHLDIKPANLMVTSKGIVKILDFGLAQFAGEAPELSSTGAVMGTVAYMAPERVMGQEVTPLTDIWAMGAVLYEMTAGRKPFRAGSKMEVLYAIVRDEPISLREIRPEVPAELEEIILRTLAKDQEQRYQNLAEVSADLARLTQGAEPGAGATGSVRPPLHRWSAAAVLVALLIFSLYLLVVPSAELDGATGVAVAGLQQQPAAGLPDWLGPALGDLLVLQLSSPALQWVEIPDAPGGVPLLGFSPEEGLAARDLARIADVAGATLVIGGSCAKGEEDGQVDVHLVIQDTSTAEIRKRYFTTGSPADWLRVAAELSEDVGETFGVTPRTDPGSGGGPPAGSQEALLWRAARTYLRQLDTPAARDILAKSLRSDEPFAVFHLGLAEAYLDLGHVALVQDEVAAAFEDGRRVSQRERLLLRSLALDAQGQVVRAASLLEALWAWEQNQPRRDEAEHLDDALRLADLWIRAGNPDRAREVLTAVASGAAADSRLVLIRSKLARGAARYAEQVKTAQNAAARARRDGTALVLAHASLLVGEAQLHQGRWASADESLRAANAIFVTHGHQRGEAESSTVQGELALAIGDLDVAAAKFDAAAAIYGALETPGAQALPAAWNALVQKRRGDIEGAAVALAQATALLAAGPGADAAVDAWVRIHVAEVEMLRGRFAAAESAFAEARSVLDDTPRPDVDALYLSVHGAFLHQRTDLALAGQELDQALRAQRAIDDGSMVVATLVRTGVLRRSQGDLDGAWELLQEAWDLAAEQQAGARLAAATGLAEIHLVRGQPERAWDSLEQPLAKAREAAVEPAIVAGARLLRAESLLWRDRPQEAVELARLALDHLPRSNVLARVQAHRVLADCYLHDGAPEAARQEVRSAQDHLRDIASPLLELPIDILAARLQALDQPEDARRELQQLLGTASTAGLSYWEVIANLALGEIEFASGADRRLSAVPSQARSKGLELIARRAERILQRR